MLPPLFIPPFSPRNTNTDRGAPRSRRRHLWRDDDDASAAAPPSSSLFDAHWNEMMMAINSGNDYEFNLLLADFMGKVERGVDDMETALHAVTVAEAEESGPTCPICIEPFAELAEQSGVALMRTSACGHAFCEPCITRWLKTSRKCPVCVQDVDPDAQDAQDAQGVAADAVGAGAAADAAAAAEARMSEMEQYGMFGSLDAVD